MDRDALVIPNKSCKAYFRLQDKKIYFSGDFDSGNLEKVQQLAPLTYRVTPGFDKTRNTTKKAFFYFKTNGFKHCTVKFIVAKAYILQYLLRQGEQAIYHPVVRRSPQGPFEKIYNDVKYNSQDEPELSFSFSFQNENWVEFAFTYPFSYEDNQALIKQLNSCFKNHSQIYFHDQVLTKTSEHRCVHLLTITSKLNISKQRQETIQGLFGYGDRPFKISKPRVVISGRVHPGQAPASHCLQGVLRFLLNEKDYRSYLLRKHFHFIIIPMLNPQGVFEGMFRNDIYGQNLNRIYLNCTQRKHKSIWSVTKFLQSLDRIQFFFDLHAHPSRKGFFIYGNAFEQFIEQTQAQIFSKIIQYNCPYFQNLDSIYTQKAMSAKDKFDNYSKQGCARVYYHKKFNLIHSYTVQCGYFSPTKLNPFPPQRQHPILGSDFVCTRDWQNISKNQYTPDSYKMLGKSLLISIIDLFHINPYTRIGMSDFKSINSLRKYTAQRIYNQVERFRLVDSNCYRKIKDIAKLIQQNYYIPKFKHHGLNISQNYGMKHRKKAFSLSSRLYPSSSLPKIKQKVNDSADKIQKHNQSQKQIENNSRQVHQHNRYPSNLKKFKGIHVNSFNQNGNNEQSAHSVSNKPIMQCFSNRKLKKQIYYDKPLQCLKSLKIQTHNSDSITPPSLRQTEQSIELVKFQKYEQTPYYQKIQNQINQILKIKLKKESKPKPIPQGMNQKQRVEAFLRKKSKSIVKLPNIQSQGGHSNK